MLYSGETGAKRSHWLAGKRTLLVGGIISLLLLLAVACGGDDDEAATSATTTAAAPAPAAAAATTTTATTTAATTTAATTTVTVPAPAKKLEPVMGGHINRIAPYIVRGVDPGHFDHRGSSAGCAFQAGYDRLIDYKRPFNPEEGVVYIPGLAESWSVDSTGTVWTFKLAKGVKFHDVSAYSDLPGGMDFNADSVLATFERVMDPDWEVSRRVWVAFRDFLTDVKAIDDYTVQFTTDEPNRTFLPHIAAPFGSAMQPRAAITDASTESGWRKTDWIVGTGPFLITSYNGSEGWDWIKNPNYFGKDPEGNQYPYVDSIKHLVVSDETARIAAFQTGRIDVWPCGWPPAPVEQAEALKGRLGDRVSHTEINLGLYKFFVLNHLTPPFDNPKVREAVRLAIGTHDLFQHSNRGKGTIGDLVDPNQWPGYNMSSAELAKLPGLDPSKRAEDVARAKALMAEAGYPDGYELKWPFAPGTSAIVGDMQELALFHMKDVLGLDIEQKSEENAARRERLWKGDFEFYQLGKFVSIAEPSGIISLCCLDFSPSQMTERPWIYPGQEELQTTWQKYMRTVDDTAAKGLMQEMTKIVHEPTFPLLYQGWLASHHMKWNYLKNWFQGPAMMQDDLKHVWIDKSRANVPD
jgi:ABC-type transport system substrate-binding protein